MPTDLGENQINLGDAVVFADTNGLLNTGIVSDILKPDNNNGGLRVSYISGTRKRVDRPATEYKYKTILAVQYANSKDCWKIPDIIAHPNCLKRPYWLSWNHLPEYAAARDKFLQEGLALLFELRNKLIEPKEKTD